jgi:hypothetical protein
MIFSELLFEYSSANPFVGIVSMIDLRIRQVGAAAHASNHTSVFISSLKNQLTTLLKFLDSGSNWNVPEPKLRLDLHAALPDVKRHVNAAISALTAGDVNKARGQLLAARKVAVKRSHLQFGDIE